MSRPTILWFRQDLRLEDNAALRAALDAGGAVVPVYILDDGGDGPWAHGGASRWWLHHSLVALDASLRKQGSRLVLRKGDSLSELKDLIRTTKAGSVYWNRRYEPAARERDGLIARELAATGIEVRSFESALLFEPEKVTNKQGRPFQVFTPFWRHCERLTPAAEVVLGKGAFPAPKAWPKSMEVEELGLRPTIPWDAGFSPVWQPGEVGARANLKAFLEDVAARYHESRNLPGEAGTSRLSPHLHFGEIGPRQIRAAMKELTAAKNGVDAGTGESIFMGEIGWREFAYHLLHHFPETPTRPLRKEFEAFPWTVDRGGRKLQAWKEGQTGYPIVDAGIRELWKTGWMHNRVRMIVASFLVKHLRIDWYEGARWFWDTLVDADLANNTLGWQWSAGCGADAAPYFRIFAPVLQGEKFDRSGAYVRRWVPELARLPVKYLQRPWEAPQEELTRAGVVLGSTYPKPIVDHATARKEALAAFQEFRRKRAEA